MFAKIGTEKGRMLFGIKRDQEEADFRNQGLGPGDAILLANDLVTGALTEVRRTLAQSVFWTTIVTFSEHTACALRIQVNLDGFALPIKKLKGTEPVESLNLSLKRLGVASTIAIASLIGVNGVLTNLRLLGNEIGAAGERAVRDAVKDRNGFELDL